MKCCLCCGETNSPQFVSIKVAFFSLWKKLLTYSSVQNYGALIYLFTPGNFAEKRVLKLVEPFSGHCLAVKR